jgi:hypothetical protein
MFDPYKLSVGPKYISPRAAAVAEKASLPTALDRDGAGGQPRAQARRPRRSAADAVPVRRQSTQQRGAIEVPAAHRLPAIHPQAVGRRVFHQRDRGGLAEGPPKTRSSHIRRLLPEPDGSSTAACSRTRLAAPSVPAARSTGSCAIRRSIGRPIGSRQTA